MMKQTTTTFNQIIRMVLALSQLMAQLGVAVGAATLATVQPPIAEVALGSANKAQADTNGGNASQVAAAINAGASVLTITKVISGSGSGPFNITVTGPNGYNNATTVDVGSPRVLTGLDTGVYTVTESTPSGWTTSYSVTTGSGYATGSNAVVTVANAITATAFSVAQITGTVFSDYNMDGRITANGVITDTGVQSVTVRAYALNGTVLGPTTTDASGRYTITTSGVQGPYRLEFYNLPEGYEPSRVFTSTGTSANGTSVQFINSAGQAAGANFGVLYPCDYCQSNPKLANVLFQNGDPLAVGSSVASLTSIAQWNYSNKDQSPAVTTVATADATGTLWGTAYQRSTRTLFTSAAVRRHTGLGPAGLGGIYQTNLSTSATSLFVDVENIGVNLGSLPSNAARFLPLTATDPSTDTVAFDAVGKMGIGQIELSQDEKTLFFTNLNDRSVYGLYIGSPAVAPISATQYAIPTVACTNGVARPWALRQYRNALYAGVVCTGEIAANSPTSANLSAMVFVMDLTSGSPSFSATPVISFPLNYPKGCAEPNYFTPALVACQWNPWSDTMSVFAVGTDTTYFAYPQPILSDIEFDVDGAMILAFADRAGLQLGSVNVTPNGASENNELGGDLLRAYRTGTATWVLENGGDKDGPGPFVPTANNKASRNDGNGPGGQGPGDGEFYYAELYNPYHEEAAMGSAVIYPGTNEVVATLMDPIDIYSGGVIKLSNATGGRNSAYEVRNGQGENFGKAAGLGEIELLCDPAPIEIGNRVWWDQDGDGEQDPGEPALAGVAVTLTWAGGSIATTTNISGTYYFTREATTGAYSTTLATNKAYTIQFGIPSGYSLTVPNAAALSGSTSSNHAISDVIDSDAVLVASIPTIYYTTGSAGQNNHGLDVGFTKPAAGAVQITNVPPQEASLRIVKTINNGSSSAPFTVTVSGPSGYNVITTVTTSAARVITGLAPGQYTVTETALPSAPSGYVWAWASYAPYNSMPLSGGSETVITVTNYLAPVPSTVTGSLQITKTVVGSAQNNFTVTVTGPSYPSGQAFGIVSGTNTVPNLIPGVYTVTETSPGAGWVTTYTVNGASNGSSAVVTVPTGSGAATPPYTILFNHANTNLQIVRAGDERSATVTGNVLLTPTLTASGITFTVKITVTGGPDGVTAVPFPPTVTLHAAQLEPGFGSGVYSSTTGALGLEYLGHTGNITTGVHVYRDPSDKMEVALTLGGGYQFVNSTFVLRDIDAQLWDSTAGAPCTSAASSETEKYDCRYSYIDRVKILSGGNFTYTLASLGQQVIAGNMITGYFADANNNGRPDSIGDWDVSGDNYVVWLSNSQVLPEFRFVYDDPGSGLDSDDDAFHDFDSLNQLILFGVRDFDAVLNPQAAVLITNTAPVAKYDLGNRVWIDTNNNGAFDTGESAPTGPVTVVLYNHTTGTAVMTTTTDASGYYTFTNLDAGSYDVF
ncbi:MAG: hypothetical protein KIH69_003510, partial [Anaerolineae bacterium]|nr:hypothetical protein [Anaerolineae bacterium]